MNINNILHQLHLSNYNNGVISGMIELEGEGEWIESISPVDGKSIGKIKSGSEEQLQKIVEQSTKAFNQWKTWPAPKRGEIVRQIGNALRAYKEPLGTLVSYEMGKSKQEGLGEVQEMIDICDFAVGLSRQLYGMTTHSERPGHRMMEQWHPLGVVGIISAFNFPVAVWSWNAFIAMVCGDVCIWKPSEKTPLTAIACCKIIQPILELNKVPEGVLNTIIGGRNIGESIAQNHKIALVSATGSTPMGRSVSKTVAERFGKTILELGGNNAIIITEDADLNIALTACVFGAVGTAGQRCTTTRRLIIEESIYDTFKQKLIHAYAQINIGNPLEPEYHMGPLIDKMAVKAYLDTIQQIRIQGGSFLIEGGVLTGNGFESGCYVKPCIAEVSPELRIVQHETFAPILYIMKYKNLEQAIEIQNAVPQGLSSSIMTRDIRKSELFLSVNGSDCGIANVNIGTSGAEIGGAFGGEKETGGGRESGSDAWKAYMRRQTVTINYSNQLPLAQGIHFDI